MEGFNNWYDKLNDLESPEMYKFLDTEFGFVIRLTLIFPHRDHPFLFVFGTIYFVPVTLFIIFYLGYTVTLQMDDIDTFAFSLHFFGIGLLGFFLYLYLSISRIELSQVLKFVGAGLFNYDEPPHPEVPKVLKQMKKEKYLMISAPIFVFFVFSFLVFGKELDALMGHASNVTYTETGVNMNLVLPVYLPFPSDEGILYLVASGLQVSAAVFMAFVIGCTTYLYVVVSLQIVFHLENLKLSLQRMDHRADKFFEKKYKEPPTRKLKKSQEYKSCLDFCFGQNVQHHKDLLKFIEFYNKVCGPPIFAAFTIGTMVIALSMFKLVDASNGFTAQDMTFVSSVFGEILHMFLLSYYGEKIGSLSDELREEIYNMDWTKYHQKFKSSMMIFQEGTKKPLVLKAGGLVSCNMETFSSVMNTAYSYFSVFNASKSIGNK